MPFKYQLYFDLKVSEEISKKKKKTSFGHLCSGTKKIKAEKNC